MFFYTSNITAAWKDVDNDLMEMARLQTSSRDSAPARDNSISAVQVSFSFCGGQTGWLDVGMCIHIYGWAEDKNSNVILCGTGIICWMLSDFWQGSDEPSSIISNPNGGVSDENVDVAGGGACGAVGSRDDIPIPYQSSPAALVLGIHAVKQKSNLDQNVRYLNVL